MSPDIVRTLGSFRKAVSTPAPPALGSFRKTASIPPAASLGSFRRTASAPPRTLPRWVRFVCSFFRPPFSALPPNPATLSSAQLSAFFDPISIPKRCYTFPATSMRRVRSQFSCSAAHSSPDPHLPFALLAGPVQLALVAHTPMSPEPGVRFASIPDSATPRCVRLG